LFLKRFFLFPFAHTSTPVVENHDEPRAVEHFGNFWRANAAALVTMTLPGLRFFFWGQKEGKTARLSVQLRRANREEENQSTTHFYNKLLSIITKDVFKNGSWEPLTVESASSGTSWRLLAWRWELLDEKILCVVNYSDCKAEGRVKLSHAAGEGILVVKDLISGEEYERNAKEMRERGLYVIVNQWWAQIFRY